MSSIVVCGIPHRPSSGRSVDALLSAIPFAKVFDRVCPNWDWSGEMWEWAARAVARTNVNGIDVEPTHFLTVQDDVILASEFAYRLDVLLHERPNDVICLQAPHPAAAAAYATGSHWYTTSDGIVGVGYVLPIPVLREFLEWRGSLSEIFVRTTNEDTLLGLFCLFTGRKVYHPLPTIIDHDTSLPSTYGNDHHEMRRSAVRFDTVTAETPIPNHKIPHFGSVYPKSADTLLNAGLIDLSRYAEMKADSGARGLRQVAYRRRAEMADTAPARVYIATPMRGDQMTRPYVQTILALLRAEDVDLDFSCEIQTYLADSDDLVRLRSRHVARMLRDTTCTHMFFVDSDVSFHPGLLYKLLRCDKSIVGAPYPRRDRIRPAARVELGYDYSLQMPANSKIEPDGTVPVDGIPLGCALIKRECLEAMCEHYRNDLGFLDAISPTEFIRSVALFQLQFKEDPGCERVLLSEDYSFCARARACGYQPYVYLGPHAPADHTGNWTFRGDVGAFGFRHG